MNWKAGGAGQTASISHVSLSAATPPEHVNRPDNTLRAGGVFAPIEARVQGLLHCSSASTAGIMAQELHLPAIFCYLAGMSNDGIQINKYISATGYCSRREADKLVDQARVMINDDIALPSSRVYPGDRVIVDDEVLKKSKKAPVYIAFNKPVGITTTTDLNDRSNIIAYINYSKRIFPVGRLDKDSEGLILLTNDGDSVNKILRAGNKHDKEYVVYVNKSLSADFARQMAGGLPVDGQTTLPCKVKIEGGKRFRITLQQGLNRQIRKMCQYLGYEVTSLQRVRIMHIHLDKLAPGKWRYLSAPEIQQLEKLMADSSKT